MADATTKVTNQIQDAGKFCSDAATSAAESAKNVAYQISDQAKEVANRASQGVANAGSYLDQKAENAATTIGGGLQAAGEAVRQHGPHDGKFGQASSALAQRLTDTGRYLEREGYEGLANDASTLIKRNPIPAILLGIGLGFLVARATTTRN